MAKRDLIRNTALLFFSCLVSIVLLEAGLRLLTPFPIGEDTNRIYDPRLAYRLSPERVDVDERGFRNAKGAVEKADLAIVGDSHTFGNNVASEDSFPSIIAEQTGRNVYNLGVGSYGIYQYKVLIEDMLQYPIKDLVLALYPANDLEVPCQLVKIDFWKTYFRQNAPNATRRCQEKSEDKRQGSVSELRRTLASSIVGSATVQVLEDIALTRFGVCLRCRLLERDEHFWFEHGQSASKERLSRHSRLTSLADPDILVNFRNSKDILIEASDKLADAAIGFVVVIIPSKERVLHEWLARTGREAPEEFVRLVNNEIALTTEFASFLEDSDIVHADALPDMADALARAIEKGREFYREGDGHPLRSGYEAYAAAAIRGLELKGRSARLLPSDPVHQPERQRPERDSL